MMKALRWCAPAIMLGVVLMGGSAAPVLAADDVWTASYWNNKNLSGDPEFTREEGDVDNDWGEDSPANGINANNFSIRWERTVYFGEGTYRFRSISDDGMRVWIDGDLIIDEWSNHTELEVTADLELDSGDYDIEVEYYDAGGDAIAVFWWDAISGGGGSSSSGSTPAAGFSFDHWQAVYFNNTTVTGSAAAQRNESNINYDWGKGSPLSGVNADDFSARWTRRVHFDTGTYRFTATSDDGARFWVDENLIIDEWFEHPTKTVSADLHLDNGDYNLEMQYYDEGGTAVARLSWALVSAPAASETTTTTTTASGGEYVVQRGDSLGKIARIYGTTVEVLVNLNSAAHPSIVSNPSLIYTGWIIKLPGTTTTATPPADQGGGVDTGGGGTYTVQRGDSLIRISKLTGVSLQTLIDLNAATYPSLRTNPDLIYQGWVLKLL